MINKIVRTKKVHACCVCHTEFPSGSELRMTKLANARLHDIKFYCSECDLKESEQENHTAQPGGKDER